MARPDIPTQRPSNGWPDLGWKQPHSRHHDPDEEAAPAPAEAAPREPEPLKPAPKATGAAPKYGVIEKGVPIPKCNRPGRRGEHVELLKAMRPGDSVLVATKHLMGTLYGVAKKAGIKVTGRQVEGGFRVWRVEQ